MNEVILVNADLFLLRDENVIHFIWKNRIKRIRKKRDDTMRIVMIDGDRHEVTAVTMAQAFRLWGLTRAADGA